MKQRGLKAELCAAGAERPGGTLRLFGSREAAKTEGAPRPFFSHGLTRIFTDFHG